MLAHREGVKVSPIGVVKVSPAGGMKVSPTVLLEDSPSAHPTYSWLLVLFPSREGPCAWGSGALGLWAHSG